MKMRSLKSGNGAGDSIGRGLVKFVVKSRGEGLSRQSLDPGTTRHAGDETGGLSSAMESPE